MGEKDDLQLKDIEKNADVDTTEKSPLKETEQQETADEAKEPIENGIKEVKPGPMAQALNHPKAGLISACLAGCVASVILILVVNSAAVALLFGSQSSGETWIEDTTPRMLRLIPTPNGAKNTIKFRAGHGKEGQLWPNLTDEIANLYAMYEKSPKKNVTNCDGRATPPNDIKLTCLYDISDIENKCNKNDNFGYASGSPCVFIQFNNVFNFTPEVYNKDDLQNESLPQKLRADYQFKGPWVECTPNTVVDQEQSGKIESIPGSELPRFSFPYTGHSDYMAPFIALKFEKPATSINIGITCRLWARNLVYNQTESGLNDTMVDDVYVPSAILPFNLFIE